MELYAQSCRSPARSPAPLYQVPAISKRTEPTREIYVQVCRSTARSPASLNQSPEWIKILKCCRFLETDPTFISLHTTYLLFHKSWMTSENARIVGTSRKARSIKICLFVQEHPAFGAAANIFHAPARGARVIPIARHKPASSVTAGVEQALPPT